MTPYSARRGPLTRQQESALHRGGVGVICGCPAAGLEDVQVFLSLRIGSDEFSQIQPAADAGEFERQLRKLRSVRNSVTVRLVPSTVEWDGAWIRSAKGGSQAEGTGQAPLESGRVHRHAGPALATADGDHCSGPGRRGLVFARTRRPDVPAALAG